MRRTILTLMVLAVVAGAAEARELTWSYVVPAVANKGGYNGTDWHTDLTVYNPHTYKLPIVVQFLESGHDNSHGVPTIETEVYAWETFNIWDVLGEHGFALRGKIGSLLVYTDDQKVSSCADHYCDLTVFARTYTLNPNGGAGEFGQAIPGFPTSLGLDKSVYAFMTQIMDDQDFRTNVGVTSLSNEMVTVRFEEQKSDGSVIGQHDEILLPFEHSQWRLEKSVTGGTVAAFITQGPANAMVVPYASVVQNVTGDAVNIEADMTVVGVSVESVRAKAAPLFPGRIPVPGFVPDRRPRTAQP
jgi:hypothetical protein